MITCTNCKFWRKIRDVDFVIPTGDYKGDIWTGPHGECNRIVDYENNNRPGIKNNAWIALSKVSVDVGLITQPDFGCVLGEKL